MFWTLLFVPNNAQLARIGLYTSPRKSCVHHMVFRMSSTNKYKHTITYVMHIDDEETHVVELTHWKVQNIRKGL